MGNTTNPLRLRIRELYSKGKGISTEERAELYRLAAEWDRRKKESRVLP